MNSELQELLHKQFTDFVEKRVDDVVLRLSSNLDYKRVQKEYVEIFNILKNLHAEAYKCVFQMDVVVGELSYHQTLAAYRQGFEDAREMLGRSEEDEQVYIKRLAS